MERLPGESANDRNDRAIRVATTWYDKHISLSLAAKVKEDMKLRVILITDDAENLRKAKEEGIIVTNGTKKSLLFFQLLSE